MVLTFLFTLIGCCLLVGYGVLIDYYRRAWASIPEFHVSGEPGSVTQTNPSGRMGQTPISVLIPVRNEEANIAQCIKSLEQQSYPKSLYEVIVIDDHSTDRTREIVTGIYPDEMCLIYTRLDERSNEQVAYKKLAIQTGIGISSGALIVTTDADCLFHHDWLRTLAAFYEETGAKFIAAPVRMEDAAPVRMGVPAHPDGSFVHPDPGILTIFQTVDFITLQGITGASVYKRFHSMCNGANLAYEKSAFVEVGGFRGIDAIPSGDDLLLMHKIYTRYPDQVFFLKSPAAIVSTQPETTLPRFIHQRVRWASKADRYDDKRISRVLLLVYVVNLMFVLLAVAACWNSWWLWLLVIGLVAKTAVEFPFVYPVARFFDQQALMPWFPLLQPLHILYTVVIGFMGKFGSYRWKDRKITK
jgi:cellulose synthase/poly-beta-1,6-N-acetylglucosamine synthase-like glycosyltransferase